MANTQAKAVVPKKPRARRTVQNTYHYAGTWEPTQTGFFLGLPDNEFIRLTCGPEKWIMEAKLNGKQFKGERPTLEAAFKAIDRILYQEHKELWPRINPHAVTAVYGDSLEGLG